MKKVDFSSLVKYFFDREIYGPNEIGVSEAIWCPRKPFFRVVMNARIRPNRDMALGALAHYAVEEFIASKSPSEVVREERVSFDLGNGYSLVGHVDLIVDGVPYELKFPTSDGPNPNVEPFYMAQLNAYLNMLDVDYGYLVEFFFNNGVYVEEVLVEKEPHSFDLLVDRAKKIVEAIKRGEIPQKSMFDWECRRCQFRFICKYLPEGSHVPSIGFSEVNLYDYSGDDRE
ncbi:MAG TPA: CRISPR-associated protein Cas4 [Euryarchaeota archaeon]|nr:CRISPR-associated protein Cas4 [Euryarchaeota archaeon]